MTFPAERPRRLRRTEALRSLVRETAVRREHLVAPIFVVSGSGVEQPIDSMPGISRYSPDRAADVAQHAEQLGIRGVLLFGIPDSKDAAGTSGALAGGPVPTAVRRIKQQAPNLAVMTDVCLCEYTDHGHCGVIEHTRAGQTVVANDPSLRLLAEQARAHAEAGADVVAPSDMMDGRIGAIRAHLDAQGFDQVAVLSYAVKYASAFYGPFRDAAESEPREGPRDRKTYQMDPANRLEASREVRLDIQEGADAVMVKPALPYLDVLSDVKRAVDVPVAAYNVSGEYSMLKAAARAGLVNEDDAILETLCCIRRAGADFIVTYHALQAARLLGGS